MAGLLALPQAHAASSNLPPTLKFEGQGISQDLRARTSFAPVIKKVSPSIVNIYSTMTIRGNQSRNPFMEDPFLRRFFGEEGEENMRSRPRKAKSLGSGVIVSPNGYILTANHVVE